MRAPPTALRYAVLIVLASLAAGPALAHDESGLAGGFTAGALHPITGVDHLMAMVAVGLWGAVLGRPLVLALPVVFPLVMALGGVAGMAGLPAPPVELGIALSVVVLGLAVAWPWRAPVWAACLVVAVFALFHGYAHGQELPSAADPIGYSVGFVLVTGALHLVGIAVGALGVRPAGRWINRVAGAAIAVAGLGFLASAAGA